MTPREAIILVRYVKACCPQQAIDEYTPDAWHELLGDLALDDCRSAVAAVARRQPFVAPAEIRAEVARIRSDRIGPDGPGLQAIPPAADPDDVHAYKAALLEQRRVAADGRALPALEASEQQARPGEEYRDVRAAWEQAKAAAHARKVAQRRAEHEALAAYRSAVESLLALDDHGVSALELARQELLGETEAARGFPALAAAPGLTDEHKVTIWAAALAVRDRL